MNTTLDTTNQKVEAFTPAESVTCTNSATLAGIYKTVLSQRYPNIEFENVYAHGAFNLYCAARYAGRTISTKTLSDIYVATEIIQMTWKHSIRD